MNDGTGFQKRRQLLEMLDRGLVMLHLDPRAPEVIVPARFKSDPVLRLNLAYQFRLPALDIGAEGVYAVLSFDKQNFGCTLPWSSIFAVTRPDAGHDGVIWPESVPPELRAWAGIEREAVIVGVNTSIEIWSQGRWQAQQAEMDEQSTDFASRFSGLI